MSHELCQHQRRWGAQMTGQMRGPSIVIWLCGESVLVVLLWAAFAWVDEIVRARRVDDFPARATD